MTAPLTDPIPAATFRISVQWGHGNDSDTESTHHRKLMQEPPLAAAGVH